MKLMKELEGDVLNVLADFGDKQYGLQYDRHTVSPEQFFGLEKNARAVPIAELVVWIGYLQWHFATFGNAMPSEPILKDFGTIRQKDALLEYDREEMLRDERGRPITRQDPDATKLHPITGEAIPDPDAKLPVYRYVNARVAQWPEAEFIVGNPPFIGGKDIRRELGGGYAEVLWTSRGKKFNSADLVMYWWDHAADILVRKGTRLRRFGFITTNSVTQKFSRRVLEKHLRGENVVQLAFAIPDHPWVKGRKKAAVRIAMTVASVGSADGSGRLLEVVKETDLETDTPTVVMRERTGVIASDLTVGVDLTRVDGLRAAAGLCYRGVQLMGAGFIVTPSEAKALGLGDDPNLATRIRPYLNARDLGNEARGVMVIDLFGLSEAEVRTQYPAVYQRILERVKPERATNNRKSYRDHWWIFGEPRGELRPALVGLSRFIATGETSPNRWFTFLPAEILPDNMLVVIADEDAATLGVLSSRIHVTWARAAGGWLGVGNDPRYNKSRCFDPFPFPAGMEAQKASIRGYAEELDALRKDVIARRNFLTMTKLYNVREKLIRGEELNDDDRIVYEEGRVGVIHELHNKIDAAVADAYGWPVDLSDQEILAHLVALNKERAAEEAQGHVRWLRPDYQIGRVSVRAGGEQIEAVMDQPIQLPQLPRAQDELAAELLSALRAEGKPVEPAAIARRFKGRKGNRDRIELTLRVLSVAGSVQRTEQGWFAPRRAN